jgi:hypothetical protein
VRFAVTNQVKDAITVVPESVWTCAIDAAGKPRLVDKSGVPLSSQSVVI